MIVKKYKTTLVNISEPIEGIYTLTFLFERGKFKFEPGQFLHLALDTEYDGIGQWPESRCFSMQNAPNENNIQITYAVKGAFTQQMKNLLKKNSEVWLKLPYGDLFSQPHQKDKTVFISGGTGITPFLSLFTDDSFSEYKNPILYAGFRSEKFNVYNKALEKASDLNPTLNIKKVYEDKEGVLNIHAIFNENGTNVSYFISGPPAMIKNFKLFLIENGVPEPNILTDDWE